MAIITLPILSAAVNADTAASNNSIAQRDAAGGLYGKIMQGTTLQTIGNIQKMVSIQTASFTADLTASDYFVSCGAAVVVTLPLASANSGVEYFFTKTDASANSITLTGALGTNTTSTQNTTLRCVSNGTSWYSTKLT